MKIFNKIIFKTHKLINQSSLLTNHFKNILKCSEKETNHSVDIFYFTKYIIYKFLKCPHKPEDHGPLKSFFYNPGRPSYSINR